MVTDELPPVTAALLPRVQRSVTRVAVQRDSRTSGADRARDTGLRGYGAARLSPSLAVTSSHTHTHTPKYI